MLKQSRISAVVFTVSDLEQTVRFYRDVLDLDVSVEQTDEGAYATAQLQGSVLVFFSGESQPGKTPIVVFGVEQGIEAVAAALADRGVEFVVPVSHAPDGGLTADFIDPDGHVLSLYQAPE